MNQQLFEELIEDTKTITQSLVQYGNRWSTIAVGNLNITDNQKEKLTLVMQKFIDAVNNL